MLACGVELPPPPQATRSEAERAVARARRERIMSTVSFWSF
jgi:hypothetical protein